MTENSKVILESLKAHFGQLMAQNTQLQTKCENLQARIDALQADLENRDGRIEQLTHELEQSEVRYKNLQISQKAQLDSRQLQENKERFAKLVREIDKCISQLSNE